jgi:serine/threonine-protein kinase
MIQSRCPKCGNDTAIATAVATIVSCPGCNAAFVRPDAGSASILSTDSHGHLVSLAEIGLSPEFQARYRLGRVLGSGGMGTVFAAEEVNGGRTVAIKFLTRIGDEQALARFVREGRVLERILHPNVVRILEFSEASGHPYLVTEYLEGGTLRSRLAARPRLRLVEAARIAGDLLAGLHACHRAGVVHRDVKPENVMFDSGGMAKVADLGLAKDSAGQAITQDGTALGTPRYMAPEQVLGQQAGPAADVYAAALVLHEMLSGRYPYKASTLQDLMHMHLSVMPPPIHQVVSGLPEELSRLIHRALAKAPADRLVSADAFAGELARIAGSAGIRSRPPGAAPSQGGRGPPGPRAVAAAVVVLVAAVIAVVAFRPRATGPSAPGGSVAAIRPRRPVVSPPTRTPSPLAFPLPAPGAPGGRGGASDAAPGPAAGTVAPRGADPTETTSDTPDLVLVGGGEFEMGSRDLFDLDNVARRVSTDDVAIDRYEVTNERFARFVRQTGYLTDAERRGSGRILLIGSGWVDMPSTSWRHPLGPADSIEGRSRAPVVQVSWNDAVAFCRWAGLRLPTEAQWERAARGGLEGARFPWGDQVPDGRARFGLRPSGRPGPVGAYAPNGHGLHDMAGNVREWCADWYAPGGQATGIAKNPTGPATGRLRVHRGGSYLSPAGDITVFARGSGTPGAGAVDIGFRGARSVR